MYTHTDTHSSYKENPGPDSLIDFIIYLNVLEIYPHIGPEMALQTN